MAVLAMGGTEKHWTLFQVPTPTEQAPDTFQPGAKRTLRVNVGDRPLSVEARGEVSPSLILKPAMGCSEGRGAHSSFIPARLVSVHLLPCGGAVHGPWGCVGSAVLLHTIPHL